MNVLSEEMHAECAACFARVSDDPLANAFARKTAVHAGMSGGKVPKEDIPAVLERVRTTKRQGQAAAYVHLPYCESKCLYCGFFGGKYSKEAEAAYVRALIGEIEAEAACASVTSAPVNALYLGGGTPTALQARELYLVLRTLKNTLPLANDCEITVEGRMHNFDEEKIEACLKAGANRFSLGVQSFDTRIRRSLGRIASGEDVCRRLETLASYNEAAIVIDLIYGLPGQSLEDWAGDIRTFLSLPLDGVDLYQLNVFPGSGLAKAMEAGKIPSAAMLAEQGAFFRQGIAMMRDARCNRLSMSHWSRSSRERNCYNPLVKSRADCLHYGAGGGGALQGWFMINEPDPARYIEHCTSGNKPVAMVAAPPDDLPVIKVILKQMEQCRLNLDDVGNALALCGGNRITDAAALYAPLIANWREAGLVTLDGPWMELTVPGQFWMVNLAQALLGWQSRMGKE
ncbi:MAG: heme anaerobic degradation radical SAM methyltransferase ChuW/HutW [Desulfovibrio sp.]|nr:heme anaerobic degradation radical SAM methyltransferase ChuW/HutW [Desulfovibrio sp.]